MVASCSNQSRLEPAPAIYRRYGPQYSGLRLDLQQPDPVSPISRRPFYRFHGTRPGPEVGPERPRSVATLMFTMNTRASVVLMSVRPMNRSLSIAKMIVSGPTSG